MTSKTYRAEQDIHISGYDCGTEIALKMVATFTLHPGRKATMIDPAEEPSIEFDQVRFFDGNDEIKLPWSIEDRFSSSEDFKSWLLTFAIEQDAGYLDSMADMIREERMLEGRS